VLWERSIDSRRLVVEDDDGACDVVEADLGAEDTVVARTLGVTTGADAAEDGTAVLDAAALVDGVDTPGGVVVVVVVVVVGMLP